MNDIDITKFTCVKCNHDVGRLKKSVADCPKCSYPIQISCDMATTRIIHMIRDGKMTVQEVLTQMEEIERKYEEHS